MLIPVPCFIHQIPPGSSIKIQHPSGPAGRGQFGNRIGGRPNERPQVSYDPLIGRKVWTRWPDDNSFYEAVITDYNPIEVYPSVLCMWTFFLFMNFLSYIYVIFQGRHALVYDIGTDSETWEWVNLSEVDTFTFSTL